jgi:5-formyltetrahydrofolate cyclo-ligase
MLRTLTRVPEDLVHGMADSEHTASLTGATPPGRDTPEFSLANRKKLLRKSLLTARSRLADDERKSAGIQLRNALLELPETGMAGTIAAYLSVGSEPDTRGLVFALWKRGAYVLLPVVRDDFDLDWASYEGPDSLVSTGRLGLLEPAEPARGVGAIASADFVIVPALAVSRDGHRLGRGAGCYDRALARVGAAVPTVALVYDDELVAELPVAPHDQRVKAVAQPGRGITRLG